MEREKKMWEYSNNELLDMHKKDPSRTDVVEQIIKNFGYDLCLKPGETKDEWFARTFGDFVNGRMCSARKVAEAMAREHRYLQSEMFKVCLVYIRVLSENYEKGYYDARDEYACKTSKRIVEFLDEQW